MATNPQNIDVDEWIKQRAEQYRQRHAELDERFPRATPIQSEEEYLADVDPTFADYGRIVMAGGAQIGSGIGWLASKFGLGDGLQKAGAEAAKSWMEGMSPQAKAALQVEFTKRDRGQLWTEAKWNKAKLTAAQSLLGTAGGMGVGSLFTKGLAKAGMSKAVTTAAGNTTRIPTTAAGAIGYGAGEALVAAPSAGAGVEEQILAMPHEKLYPQSLEYQLVYDALEGLPEDRERRAKQYLAEAAAGDAFALALVSTFILSAPAGNFMAKITKGMPLTEGGGRLAGGARGAGTEALQEFAQSGAEQVASNVGLRQADPSVGLLDDVLEQSVGGALAGGMMGAGPGFAADPSSRALNENLVDPSNSPLAAIDQANRPPDDGPPYNANPTLDELDALSEQLYEDTGEPKPPGYRDPLEVVLENAGKELELDLAEMQYRERQAQELKARAESESLLAEAQRREQEELEAIRQAAEQAVKASEAAAGASESEMASPQGQQIPEGELIDLEGGQPSEGVRQPFEEGEILNPAGGRPQNTAMADALRAAGVVQRPSGPSGPGPSGSAPTATPAPLPPDAADLVSPDVAPQPDRRDTRAAEALRVGYESETRLPNERLLAEAQRGAAEAEAEAEAPAATEAPAVAEAPAVVEAPTAAEADIPFPELEQDIPTELLRSNDPPQRPNVPTPTRRPNYELDTFLTTRAKETTDKRLSMDKFESEGLDRTDMRRPVYGGRPAFSTNPNAMGPDDVAEFLNENNYPNPYDGGSTGTWDANQALEAVREEVMGTAEIVTGAAMENRTALREYEEALEAWNNRDRLLAERAQAADEEFEAALASQVGEPEPGTGGVPSLTEQAAPPEPQEGEQLDMMPAPTGRDAAATEDQRRQERAARAPEADTGVGGDLFTGTSDESIQAAEMEAAQTDVEEAPIDIPPREMSPEDRDALAEETSALMDKYAEQGERNMGFDKTEIMAGIQRLKVLGDPRAEELEAKARILFYVYEPRATEEVTIDEQGGMRTSAANFMSFAEATEKAAKGEDFQAAASPSHSIEFETAPDGKIEVNLYKHEGVQSILVESTGVAGYEQLIDKFLERSVEASENRADVNSLPTVGPPISMLTPDGEYVAVMGNIFPAPKNRNVLDEASHDKTKPDSDPESWSMRKKTSKMKFGSRKDAKATLEKQKAEAKRQGETGKNKNKVVISLFDATGAWSQPYVDAGYTVLRYDSARGDDIHSKDWFMEIEAIKEKGYEIVGVIAAPPCTSFSNAGAQWWGEQHDAPNKEWVRKKYGDYAAFHYDRPIEYAEAIMTDVLMIVDLARPTEFYAMENPSGRLRKKLKEGKWKTDIGLPSLSFDPWHFGDPYTKRTHLWGEMNTDLPLSTVVPVEGSKMHKMSSGAEKIGGERSATPEGFAYAFFMANNGNPAIEAEPTPSEDAGPATPGTRVPTRSEIEAVEAQTVTPTEAQAEAGNYKKPSLDLEGGVVFRMEMPEGVKNKGSHPYGYVEGTKGADKEPVDMFVNKNMEKDWANDVYIVDQQFEGVGGFDEHKIMYGFNNMMDARRAYRAGYGKDWKNAGPVTKMSLEEFRTWIKQPAALKKPAALWNGTKEGQKNLKSKIEDIKLSTGRDMLNAPNDEFVRQVLSGGEDKLGDVPDTMPLNMAVSELLKVQEQRASAPAAPAGPTRGEIETAIKPVEDRMPGAPVTLLDNYKQAPSSVVAEMESRGITGVKAVFDPNTNQIYMFGDQVESVEQAVRIALHEKTHRGLREAFGDDLVPLLDDIYRNASERRQGDLQTIIEKYKLDTSTQEGRREAAEELLAHMAENNIDDGMVNRAVAFVRKILRDMGLVQEFSDNDIRALLREAQGAVGRRGNRTTGVTIEEEVMLDDTGEVFIVEQQADDLISGINQRIEICEKLRKCL